MTYLRPAMLCKFDSVVWNELMDITVLIPFRLGMTNQYNHLQISVKASRRLSHDRSTYAGFPHVGDLLQ